MSKKILIIGHPLCAAENRLPFELTSGEEIHLAYPKYWRSPGLQAEYLAPIKIPPRHHALNILGAGRNSIYVYLKLKVFLNRLRPDFIYCWEEPWCLSTFQIARWCKKHKRPFIFYSAENKTKPLPWPFSAIQNFGYKYAQGAVVITSQASERLIQSGFSGKVYLIPLWVRSFSFAPKMEFTYRLVYLGRLIPLKGVDLLIKALVDLPQFTLAIVGNGPERKSLEMLADKFNLSSRVQFLGGISNDSLESLLKKFDIAVFPTRENPKQAEQFGKAALECISLGLGVLASHTGNYIQLAREFPTLKTGNFTTASGIAKTIKKYVSELPSQNLLAQASSQILELYSPQKVAEHFRNLWKGEEIKA